jgi:hypothetical protein
MFPGRSVEFRSEVLQKTAESKIRDDAPATMQHALRVHWGNITFEASLFRQLQLPIIIRVSGEDRHAWRREATWIRVDKMNETAKPNSQISAANVRRIRGP